MTPEERFRKIENLLKTLSSDLVSLRIDVQSLTGNVKTLTVNMEALTGDVRALTSTTGDLAGLGRYLVDVQGELVESNTILRQIAENHARRLERLEGLN